MSDEPIRVLIASPRPPGDGNPYLRMLADGMPTSVAVEFFTWRRAFWGSYHVVHLHWPETLFRGAGRWRTMLKSLLALALCLRLMATRTPVVRTVHNHQPHEPGGRIERAGISLLESRVTLEIHLVEASRAAARRPGRVIPHGHYLGAYRQVPRITTPTAMCTFGTIRAYKGVDRLIEVFQGVADPRVTLTVAGEVADRALETRIRQAADGDDRVHLSLFRASTDETAELFEHAGLVVLPYTDYLNSGVALLSLSLGRPVLMPRSAASVELQDEFGTHWVHLYRAPLTPDRLASAVEQVERQAAVLWPPPDMSRRDWKRLGRQHEDTYRHAMELR